MKKIINLLMFVALALLISCKPIPPELGDPPTTTKAQTK